MVAGCLLLLATVASGADQWLLLPEPDFMGRKGVQAIPGAKSTVLAPARLGEFGLEFPTEGEWQNAGLSEVGVLAASQVASAAWLKEVKPELVRDANKVVDYAVLRSGKYPICGAVLSPEFLAQFEAIFGPKPIVVIPNRHTVFVFPGLAGKHERFGPSVIAAWKSGAPKVSLEVFELSNKGLRAIGAFAE